MHIKICVHSFIFYLKDPQYLLCSVTFIHLFTYKALVIVETETGFTHTHKVSTLPEGHKLCLKFNNIFYQLGHEDLVPFPQQPMLCLFHLKVTLSLVSSILVCFLELNLYTHSFSPPASLLNIYLHPAVQMLQWNASAHEPWVTSFRSTLRWGHMIVQSFT